MIISLILYGLSIPNGFNIGFINDGLDYQDLFIFNGINSSAHLFRHNYTISLFIWDKESSLFEMTANFTNIHFTWPNILNGDVMSNISEVIEYNNSIYNHYTFFDPIPVVENALLYSKQYEQSYEIIFGAALLFLLGVFSPETAKFIKTRYTSRNGVI